MARRPLIIGVDIDGVLADYAEAMSRAACSLGIPVAADADPTRWDMIEPRWFRSGRERAACHEFVTGHLEDMKVIDPQAHHVLRHLRAEGHRIVLVTSRHAPSGAPYGDDQVRRQTAYWLATNGLPHDELRFSTGPKTGIGIDVLIDDAPHVIAAHQAAAEPVVIYHHAYNRHLPGRRVKGLHELPRLLRPASSA